MQYKCSAVINDNVKKRKKGKELCIMYYAIVSHDKVALYFTEENQAYWGKTPT